MEVDNIVANPQKRVQDGATCGPSTKHVKIDLEDIEDERELEDENKYEFHESIY